MSSKNPRRKPTLATSRSRRSCLLPEERFLCLMVQNAEPGRLEGDHFVLPGERLKMSSEQARDLVRRDLAVVEGGRLLPTAPGKAWVARSLAAEDSHRVQHGQVCAADEIAPGARIEQAESPLLWLHRRKDSSGNPLIGAAMFAAGERLRADFTFGNLEPRITASWDAAGGRGSASGVADPSDGALAARQRVRRAVEWVGPELSGVLLDVCCFLKGLEDVERDRRWPARSAKIILALALGKLARHYGYSDIAEGTSRSKAG